MRSNHFVIIAVLAFSCSASPDTPPGFVEGRQDLFDASGLAGDPRLQVVKANCTACHSAKMIIQNRATREGWKNMISWMQETQKLWDLGENEETILDYLEKYYSPELIQARRSNLENIDWYVLD